MICSRQGYAYLGIFFKKKSEVTYYKKGSLVSCITIVYLAAFHSFFFLVGIIYFVYQEKACHGQTAYGPHVLLDEIATSMFYCFDLFWLNWLNLGR